MSEAETMRLVAEVVDKFSKPLKDLREHLKGIQGGGHGDRTTREFERLHKVVGELRDGLKEGVKPALEAIGVTTLSVAGAIAGISAAVRGFSGAAAALANLRTETGVTINHLRELDALSRRVGSAPEAMRAGVQQFAVNMEQLRRHRGALNDFFNGQADTNVRAFGESLRHVGSNDEALGRVLGYLEKIPNAVQRKYLLEALGLPSELGRLSGGELKAALEDIRKHIGSLSDEGVKKGQELDDAFSRMRESAEKLREEIGVNLAPTVTELATAFEKFTGEHRKEIIDAFTDIATFVKSQDWKQFGSDLKGAATEINGIAQAMGGWVKVGEALIALKLAAEVAKITGSVKVLFGLAAPPWVKAIAAMLALKGDTNKDATDFTIAKQRGMSPDELKRSDIPPVVDPWASFFEDFRNRLEVERRRQSNPYRPNDFGDVHRESYTGSDDAAKAYGGGRFKMFAPGGPRATNASLTVGEGSGGAIDKERAQETISAGTRTGVLEALREYFATSPDGSGLTPGGPGGAVRASLGGGGGGVGAGGSGGGSGGGDGGTGIGAKGNIRVGETAGSAGANKLMADLMRRGWSKEAAAVAAGNVGAESGFKTGSVGDHGTSFGLAQWHGPRARRMMEEARKAGVDWRNWDFQAGFLDREWRERFGDASVKSHDFDHLARQGRAFEGYRTNTFGARNRAAQRYMRDFRDPARANWSVDDVKRAVYGKGRVAGLNPEFADRLRAMKDAAPAELRGAFEVASGYRSMARQAELFARHPDRRWVAPPGHSMHNYGLAADLRFMSPAARAWVHAHAAEYGLRFRMGHEPWHIEPDAANRGRLLDEAKKSGVLSHGGAAGKHHASLQIDLNGFPRGTRTAQKVSGFKEVRLNRGRQMVAASEDA